MAEIDGPDMKMEISVVLPCYNERTTIGSTLAEIHTYLKKNFRRFEILAVDDGSLDGTLQELYRIAEHMNIRIINHEINEGKGKAVKDGVLQSQGEIILFLDADLAISIEELDRFCPVVDSGYDLVLASRFVPGAKEPKRKPWYRKFSGKGFRFLRMLILNDREIQDTQCGFKLFKREAAFQIFSHLKVNRFAFDSEIVYLAKKLGYRVKELPVNIRTSSRTSVKLYYDPFNMFLDLLKIRFRNYSNLTQQKTSNKKTNSAA